MLIASFAFFRRYILARLKADQIPELRQDPQLVLKKETESDFEKLKNWKLNWKCLIIDFIICSLDHINLMVT